jgi:glycosyltransferase involved in cell wall biosynthesis
MRVDQIVPTFHRGDAIGNSMLHLQKFFRSQGFDSRIYCMERDEGLEDKCFLFDSFPKPSSSDITIFHYALISSLTDPFLRLPGRKVLLYHNVTPHTFFEPFSDSLTDLLRRSREELKSIAPDVDLVLADSDFNSQELLAMGARKAVDLPLFVDFENYKRPENRFMFELFQDERINILFVGRIVPNKRIEDLIKVLFYYKKYISPLVRLIVIGKTTSLPKYYQSLVRLADEFYLEPNELCFTGHVTDEEMFALYKASHVFLSLSEHEGFGLPLIESMIFDLPVVAYDCTAVPQTMGRGGILIKNKNADLVAELVRITAEDQKLREKIIRGQRQRLEEFKAFDREKVLLENIRLLGE